ncbi:MULTISPECIES: helix-turn-helix domain-containing protein [Fructobacillus]|uniref:Transcriptional regulator, Cro/CI family n=1 Tax=Fructobacillus tropaeoli TaxID=709323 RepID=A0A3F3H3G1_9LACO|nr:helix-turn-helix domain-containing protein [Fructobacillus tropaeoli]GAP05004.1 transcriptional regulator, Cro/CI family [Fructobacillus tropaeoli]CAK1246092.1 Predicted transcriptional regulator [Fructobacillus cardui]
MDIHNNLQKIRKQKKVSQEELAKLAGVSRQTISLYERGKREPRMATWKKFSDFFGVDVGYLQGLTNFKNEDEAFLSFMDKNEFDSEKEEELLKNIDWQIMMLASFYDDFFDSIAKNIDDDFLEKLDVMQKRRLAFFTLGMIKTAGIFSATNNKKTNKYLSDIARFNLQEENNLNMFNDYKKFDALNDDK